jgi:ABC-type nitrate/sulfonate/bicarbonate transport system permease component
MQTAWEDVMIRTGLGLFINYASATYDPAGVFAGVFILLAFVMMMSAIATDRASDPALAAAN